MPHSPMTNTHTTPTAQFQRDDDAPMVPEMPRDRTRTDGGTTATRRPRFERPEPTDHAAEADHHREEIAPLVPRP